MRVVLVVAVFLAAVCSVDCKKSPSPTDGGGGGVSGSGGAAGIGGALGTGGASGSAGQAGGGTGGAAGAATCQAADHSYVAAPVDVDSGNSCTFTIPGDPTGGTKDRIKVSVDGGTITRDPARAQGWDYTDTSLATLQLFGTACAAVTDGGAHTVCVTFIYLPP